MFRYFHFYLLLLIVLLDNDLNAQDINLSTIGWFTVENEHALSDSWSIKTDVHVRSTDNFGKLGNILVRNWLDYSFSDRLSFGLGYAYLGTWHNDISFPATYFPENRPFQQFQHSIKQSSLSKISHRARLEQRFFSTEILPLFSLRSRYSIGWKNHLPSKPLGVSYTYLENEVFFNLIGQRLSGGKLFEQNRVYGGVGIDLPQDNSIELGSYYEIQNDVFRRTNHSLIVQIRLIMQI